MKKLFIILTVLLFLPLIHPPGVSAVQPGDKLISFTGKTIDGKTINMDSIIGTSPVLLFFWATW